jgi:hypothetical protein
MDRLPPASSGASYPYMAEMLQYRTGSRLQAVVLRTLTWQRCCNIEQAPACKQWCFVPCSPASMGSSIPKSTKPRLHAGASSSSFGSATPRSTHSTREATIGTRLGRPPALGAVPGLKAPASLPPGVNRIPFRKNFWSPQPKVPAAISVENRWLPRAHRELVFSSRGRRHAGDQSPISPEVSGKTANGSNAFFKSNRHFEVTDTSPKRYHVLIAPLSSFGPGGNAITRYDSETDT